MTLQVVEPGLATILVDRGRPASRGLGVPVGGAADRWSLALGNALVGNPPDAPALEIALAGPALRAEREVGCVVFGAPFELLCERRRLRAGMTFTLAPGEEVQIAGTPQGMRAYFCVRGGFRAPCILGSRSALEPVRAGQDLDCPGGRIHARFLRLPRDGDETAQAGVTGLRVLDGAQADWFERDALSGQTFQVTPASNRMGLRLEGQPLRLPARELVSEPVCPGTVQVTRDGQCIILGVDGQTIGGYPKVAEVISADLDVLGQLRPGDEVCFVRVSLAEAERLYRERRRRLGEWVVRLRTAEIFARPIPEPADVSPLR